MGSRSNRKRVLHNSDSIDFLFAMLFDAPEWWRSTSSPCIPSAFSAHISLGSLGSHTGNKSRRQRKDEEREEERQKEFVFTLCVCMCWLLDVGNVVFEFRNIKNRYFLDTYPTLVEISCTGGCHRIGTTFETTTKTIISFHSGDALYARFLIGFRSLFVGNLIGNLQSTSTHRNTGDKYKYKTERVRSLHIMLVGNILTLLSIFLPKFRIEFSRIHPSNRFSGHSANSLS